MEYVASHLETDHSTDEMEEISDPWAQDNFSSDSSELGFIVTSLGQDVEHTLGNTGFIPGSIYGTLSQIRINKYMRSCATSAAETSNESAQKLARTAVRKYRQRNRRRIFRAFP